MSVELELFAALNQEPIDIHQIESILLKKPDLNILGPNGTTVVTEAARLVHPLGKAEAMELYLKHGPAIVTEAVYLEKFLPNTEVLQLILKQNPKPDLNLKDKHGRTVMMNCSSANVEVLQLLLNENPKLDLKDNQDRTAFMLSAWGYGQGGNPAALKFLFKHSQPKPDLKLKDKDGRTAFMLAASSKTKNPEILQFLFEQDPEIELDLQDYAGNTAVMLAISSRSLPMLQFLLNQNPQLNLPDHAGNTAVMLAIRSGNIPALELLLKQNPLPYLELADKDGNTAVMLAASSWDLEALKLLLKQNPQPKLNVKNKAGYTAVMLATISGNLPALELLLEHSPEAQLKLKDNDGRTVVMLATYPKDIEVLQYILKQSPQPKLQLKDNLDRTAFMWAASLGKLTALQLLFDQSPRPDLELKDKDGFTAVMLAVRSGKIQAVRFFFNQNPRPNLRTQTSLGKTILRLATENGQLDILKELLLQDNHHLETPDVQGASPLLWAVFQGRLATSEFLLKNKANIQAIDQQGNSPLHLAAQQGDWPMLELLIKSGADLQAVNHNQQSPSEVAALHGHRELAEKLLKPDLAEPSQPVQQAAARLKRILGQLDLAEKQPQPSRLEKILGHLDPQQPALKSSLAILRQYPQGKAAPLPLDRSTQGLMTQTEASLKTSGKSLEYMLETFQFVALPMQDLLARERASQCADNLTDTKVTLYTGFDQNRLFLSIIIKELIEICNHGGGAVDQALKNRFLSHYQPSRSPNPERYRHQDVNELRESPEDIDDPNYWYRYWNWCNASLFGNHEDHPYCSLNYFSTNFNIYPQSVRTRLAEILQDFGLEPRSKASQEFIERSVAYLRKLQTTSGGFQVFEVPYAKLDHFCHNLRVVPFGAELPVKISEYILEARINPEKVGPDFNRVEIMMMSGFLFNPDTGIRTQIYHNMEKEHPATFAEFKQWLRTEFIRLAVNQHRGNKSKQTIAENILKKPTESPDPEIPRTLGLPRSKL